MTTFWYAPMSIDDQLSSIGQGGVASHLRSPPGSFPNHLLIAGMLAI
jgi:hypothetical protein